MKRSIVRAALGSVTALVCGLSLFGCSDSHGFEAEDLEPKQAISWEDFKRAATRHVDGRDIYMVEWDMAVTEAELRERYEAYARDAQLAGEDLGETAQPSIVNRVNGSDDIWHNGKERSLTYCVSDTFGASKERAVAEMAEATAAWEREAGVHFAYVPTEDDSCSNANTNVVFAVRPWTSGGACAFFPSGGGCVPRTLVINFNDLDNNYGSIAPNVRTVGVFRHELGHILGLRHEHTRPDTGVCFEDNDWRALTSYDKSSVMHYPWCNGSLASDLSITSLDALGVSKLYGPPSSVAYTPGDFNGDGKTDLVITTSLGSFWYFSNGDGTFSQPYTRGDLPLGAVAYTPGDFNGDGKTDLVITTSSGSFWYFSNGNGTWSTPYTRADLPLDAVAYTPGDFNGDGKTDLVITTKAGSSWQFSNGNGTWTTPYTRADLPLGAVAYTPGDFSGDGKTDLVITTSLGSFWYFSVGNGTWTTPYTRADLPLGAVAYTAGDFSGGGKTDLVITTSLGSFWYFSSGNGSWTTPYTRTDLPLGAVAYTPGDFNGDGKTDLVITTSLGSFWYFSSGNGSWTTPYTRTDRPLGTVAYTAGDFSGGGKTDLVITTPAGSSWYFSNGNGTWSVPYTRSDLPL